MYERACGILLHISSLPGPYGIGDLGPASYRFVDVLQKARQHYWQVLPVNPTEGVNKHSPYSSLSVFAGNTLFISPEWLVADGLLSSSDIDICEPFNNSCVEYNAVVSFKNNLLDKVYRRYMDAHRSMDHINQDVIRFTAENEFWLDDYALFVVIKRAMRGCVWSDWPQPLKQRDTSALEEFRASHRVEIEKTIFDQFLFFRQWSRLKSYCSEHSVKLFGDVSIYADYDSADVWAHPEQYKLDQQFHRTVVAGVPPDYFSDTGQRWGNPVYNWEVLQQSNYEWWVKRFAHNFKLFDLVRIDHFRGLVQCWEIPVREHTAKNGKWADVPTDDIFSVLETKFSKPLPIVAEDLGYITDDVREAMRRFHLAGMKVLLFAFNDDLINHPYLPHNYSEPCVVYTGTHDNNTVIGWFENEATKNEKLNLKQYLGRTVSKSLVHWDLIQLAYESPASIAIIPMQDVLGLNAKARMNKPATTGRNWKWRMEEKDFHNDALKKLAKLAESTRRAG